MKSTKKRKLKISEVVYQLRMIESLMTDSIALSDRIGAHQKVSEVLDPLSNQVKPMLIIFDSGNCVFRGVPLPGKVKNE